WVAPRVCDPRRKRDAARRQLDVERGAGQAEGEVEVQQGRQPDTRAAGADNVAGGAAEVAERGGGGERRLEVQIDADGAVGRRGDVAGGDDQVRQAQRGQPLQRGDDAVEGGRLGAVEVGDGLLHQAALQHVLEDRPGGGVAGGQLAADGAGPGDELLQAALQRGDLCAVERHAGGGDLRRDGRLRLLLLRRGEVVDDEVRPFAGGDDDVVLPPRVVDQVAHR